MEKNKNYTYEAFISYRHCPFDSKIALLIHRLLETFRVPKRFSSSGKSGILRKIFLDNKELPTSSDLSKSIYDALLESRYLIVVCSKQTPFSDYVKQEIETFVKLGRKDRIIPVLIEGNREISFPDVLQQVCGSENSCGHLIDIRTTSVSNSKKLLMHKIYDIISILTGFITTDLLEAGTRKRNFHLAITSMSIAAILIAFGGIALYSTLWMYNLSEQMKYRTSLMTDSVQKLLDSSLPVFHVDEEAARTGITVLRKNEESLLRLLEDETVISTLDAFKENSDYFTSEETDMMETLAENLLYQGDLYSTLGEYDNSRLAYEEALKLWLSAKEPYTKSTYLKNKYDALLLRTYEKLGDTWVNMENYQQALACYQYGVDVGSKWDERKKEEGSLYDIVLNSSLGRIYYHMGELHYHFNDMDRSSNSMNQAIFYLNSLMKNNQFSFDLTHIRWLYELAEDCTALRELYSIFGDNTSLKNVVIDEIKIRQLILEKDSSIRNRYELAQCYSLSAGFSMQENNPSECEKMAAEELAIRLELDREAGENTNVLFTKQQYATNILRIGSYYQQEGKTAQAESAYEKGFPLLKDCVHEDTHLLQKNRITSELLWHSTNSLALQIDQEKYEEVLVQCMNDRKWIDSLFGTSIPDNNSFIREMADRNEGNTYFYEALALMKKDALEASLESIQKGIALLKPHYEKNSQNAGYSLSYLYDLKARVQILLRAFPEAQENAYEAAVINPGNSEFQITLAHAYLFNGQTDKAKKIYLQYREAITGNGEKTVEQIIKEDFSFFREHGLSQTDMDEIEGLLW